MSSSLGIGLLKERMFSYHVTTQHYILGFIVICLQLLPTLSFTAFLFGDSLVDAGNNDFLFTLSKADSPPYGIDFAPSGGRPTGRFTNGRTISDIIGEALGGSSFSPPYLAPDSLSSATENGINYASGSSGILMETGSLFIGRIPLQEQVNYFEQTRSYIVNIMGENGARKLLQNAIFTLAIGSNDILNYIEPSIPFLGQEKPEPTLFQGFMVTNLTMQLKRLYEFGARKFVVVGVGPLGCIPFVRAIRLVTGQRCTVEVNELVQGYNNKLKLELDHMNKELGPEAVFVYANSYKIFLDIIQNFHHYGFQNAKDPCCGGYFPPFVCFQGESANTSSNLCEDRSKYVFWDAYHPTEAANLIMAKKLLDGDEAIASPINIRQLNNHKL